MNYRQSIRVALLFSLVCGWIHTDLKRSFITDLLPSWEGNSFIFHCYLVLIKKALFQNMILFRETGYERVVEPMSISEMRYKAQTLNLFSWYAQITPTSSVLDGIIAKMSENEEPLGYCLRVSFDEYSKAIPHDYLQRWSGAAEIWCNATVIRIWKFSFSQRNSE